MNAAEQLFAYARDLLVHSTVLSTLPDSGKCLVFDSQLALKHAFFALVEHDVKGAPVWDSKIAQYVGMVTVTDFIDVIMHFHDQELSKQEFVETLEKETCQSWAMKRPNKKVFIDVLPEDKVIDAIQIMQEKNIHRLPVVSKIENENTVLGLLNHQRLLRFLVSKLQAKYSDLLKIVKIQDLKIESASELKYSTDPKCKLIDVLKMIHKNRLPVIPILDESGKYLDAYSRSDVRFLAMDQTYDRLEMPVEDALADHRASRVIPSVRKDETLESVFKMLLSTRKHACIVVDEEEKAKGIISLSDIFQLVLHASNVQVESKS